MKTPEELAEEYNKQLERVPIMYYLPTEPCRKAFLAGYQAARDQLADVGKVIHLAWEQIWRVVPSSADSGRTPCFNETVLGFTCDGRMVFAQHSWDGWIIESDGMERPISYITHWMPLPQPPKEDE